MRSSSVFWYGTAAKKSGCRLNGPAQQSGTSSVPETEPWPVPSEHDDPLAASAAATRTSAGIAAGRTRGIVPSSGDRRARNPPASEHALVLVVQDRDLPLRHRAHGLLERD